MITLIELKPMVSIIEGILIGIGLFGIGIILKIVLNHVVHKSPEAFFTPRIIFSSGVERVADLKKPRRLPPGILGFPEYPARTRLRVEEIKELLKEDESKIEKRIEEVIETRMNLMRTDFVAELKKDRRRGFYTDILINAFFFAMGIVIAYIIKGP